MAPPGIPGGAIAVPKGGEVVAMAKTIWVVRYDGDVEVEAATREEAIRKAAGRLARAMEAEGASADGPWTAVPTPKM